jgi:hypothetical protein
MSFTSSSDRYAEARKALADYEAVTHENWWGSTPSRLADALRALIESPTTEGPQFAPEGEPDEYRDDYEAILGSITEITLVNDEMQSSATYRVNLDGHHILAYLSEKNR